MPKTLIIGYGNLLRGDDAVGCHAAHELEQLYRDAADVEVIASQQLTPELADDVSRSNFVLFLDACSGEYPGTIRRARVMPDAAPSGFTHSLTPASLLTAAEQLYGDAPEAMSLTLAGWSFQLSNRLSPGARQLLPEFIRQARETVQMRRRSAATLHTV